MNKRSTRGLIVDERSDWPDWALGRQDEGQSTHDIVSSVDGVSIKNQTAVYRVVGKSVQRVMQPKALIGIAGPARSGKDTTANKLIKLLGDTWGKASFADPIKAMLSAIDIDCSDDNKAVELDHLGVTPRHMMQTLGTEWGRQLINNNIWVIAFEQMSADKKLVVPDVRFENEADLIRKHGILVHVVGRGGIEGDHVSEQRLDYKEGDIVIDNSGDLGRLYAQVVALANKSKELGV